MDRERFLAALQSYAGAERDPKGIGTLGERSVHAVLKAYFEPQEDNTEIKIGSFVADIAGEDGIIEIQTRALYRLKKKLDCFLEYARVTVVHPVFSKKYLRWADPATGELSDRRLSPKKESIYTAMDELVGIKNYLDDPNFAFVCIVLECEDIRLLDGYSKDKKKGATKLDRYPLDIVAEYRFECPQDYMMLVPEEIEGEFATSDFAKAAKISRRLAQSTLNILSYTGCVKCIGKKNRENLYMITEI
ncbi:MAG: hypothetical protein K6F91_02550 [Ruminococcus sp.]|nr:hypothetical protein [Ruminococcus sp.]